MTLLICVLITRKSCKSWIPELYYITNHDKMNTNLKGTPTYQLDMYRINAT